MLNKDKFIKIMTGLCEVFNKTPSEFLLDTYYELLKFYSDEQVNSAMMECLKSYKYNLLPKPAEILEFIEGSKDDKALVAWLQVMEAVKKGGYYTSIEFADPIISHCIMQFGGWMQFCSAQKDELPFIEKRFKDYYRLYLRRGITKPIKLIGFIEGTNKREGFLEYIPETLRIGFEQKQIEIKQ